MIHYDQYYKREKVNIGVIMSMTDGSTTISDIEVESTAAGVIENDKNCRGCRTTCPYGQ